MMKKEFLRTLSTPISEEEQYLVYIVTDKGQKLNQGSSQVNTD